MWALVKDMTPSLKQISYISIVSLVMVSAAMFAPAQSAKSKSKAKPAKTAPANYKAVQAIFDKNCLQCHSAPKPKAMLNLQSYEGTMKGNDDGSVITPGKPDQSLLFRLINLTGRKQMPPKKNLTKAEIATIGAWIKAGATNK